MLFQTSLFQTWFWTDLFFSFLQRHVGLWFWWENWSKLRSRQTLHLGLVWTRPQTVAGHEESQFYGSCQELLPRKTKTKLQLLLVSVNLAPAVETVGGCLRSERMFQKHFWNSNIHSVKKKNKKQTTIKNHETSLSVSLLTAHWISQWTWKWKHMMSHWQYDSEQSIGQWSALFTVFLSVTKWVTKSNRK